MVNELNELNYVIICHLVCHGTDRLLVMSWLHCFAFFQLLSKGCVDTALLFSLYVSSLYSYLHIWNFTSNAATKSSQITQPQKMMDDKLIKLKKITHSYLLTSENPLSCCSWNWRTEKRNLTSILIKIPQYLTDKVLLFFNAEAKIQLFNGI